MRAAESSVSRPKRVYRATRSGLDTGQTAALGAQEAVTFKYLARQTPPGPTRPTLATYAVQPDSNTPNSIHWGYSAVITTSMHAITSTMVRYMFEAMKRERAFLPLGTRSRRTLRTIMSTVASPTGIR